MLWVARALLAVTIIAFALGFGSCATYCSTSKELTAQESFANPGFGGQRAQKNTNALGGAIVCFFASGFFGFLTIGFYGAVKRKNLKRNL